MDPSEKGLYRAEGQPGSLRAWVVSLWAEGFPALYAKVNDGVLGNSCWAWACRSPESGGTGRPPRLLIIRKQQHTGLWHTLCRSEDN